MNIRVKYKQYIYKGNDANNAPIIEPKEEITALAVDTILIENPIIGLVPHFIVVNPDMRFSTVPINECTCVDTF